MKYDGRDVPVALRLVLLRLPMLLVALAAMVLATSTITHAAEFKLSKGGQYELCRTFHENLKRFPDLPEVTMEVPIHADFADVFRKVEWEELDPFEHEDVLREAIAQFRSPSGDWQRMSSEDREAYVDSRLRELLTMARKGELLPVRGYPDHVREGRIGLGRARFDVNHDGEAETVYRFGFRLRPMPYPEPHLVFGWTYHVMPWDQEKASRQLQHYGSQNFDAFYYRGRIYLASPHARYELNVIEPNQTRGGRGFALIYVCEFDPAE